MLTVDTHEDILLPAGHRERCPLSCANTENLVQYLASYILHYVASKLYLILYTSRWYQLTPGSWEYYLPTNGNGIKDYKIKKAKECGIKAGSQNVEHQKAFSS